MMIRAVEGLSRADAIVKLNEQFNTKEDATPGSMAAAMMTAMTLAATAGSPDADCTMIPISTADTVDAISSVIATVFGDMPEGFDEELFNLIAERALEIKRAMSEAGIKPSVTTAPPKEDMN